MRLAPPPILLLPLSALAILAGLAFGRAAYTVPQVVTALLHADSSAASAIVWKLRLPRVLSARACGGLLALARVLLQ